VVEWLEAGMLSQQPGFDSHPGKYHKKKKNNNKKDQQPPSMPLMNAELQGIL